MLNDEDHIILYSRFRDPHFKLKTIIPTKAAEDRDRFNSTLSLKRKTKSSGLCTLPDWQRMTCIKCDPHVASKSTGNLPGGHPRGQGFSFYVPETRSFWGMQSHSGTEKRINHRDHILRKGDWRMGRTQRRHKANLLGCGQIPLWGGWAWAIHHFYGGLSLLLDLHSWEVHLTLCHPFVQTFIDCIKENKVYLESIILSSKQYNGAWIRRQLTVIKMNIVQRCSWHLFHTEDFCPIWREKDELRIKSASADSEDNNRLPYDIVFQCAILLNGRSHVRGIISKQHI